MSAFVNIIIKSGLGRIPVPVFGSVATLTTWARYSSRSMVPAIPWAFPLVVGGLWFIWPAVDEEFKIDMGFMKNPNPAPAPVEEVKLDAVAKKAVENAYKPHEEERRPSEKEVEVEKELRKGNFTPLEKDWDDFLAKAIKPGEDDDDDDDDEDEDDEEEEGEEEGGDDEDDDE